MNAVGFVKWNVLQYDRESSSKIAAAGFAPLFATDILAARGFASPERAGALLSASELESPFVLADMDKAADRIRRAMDEEQKICVYGDYDADGITSTVMLYTYLSEMGADVAYYIPDRDTEGYGLNKEALQRIYDDDIDLIITVDNGISALEEAAFAKELGMDMVITDHHQPREVLPEAVAVVNPHRSDCRSAFKHLAGVGVAFKLIAALEDGDYEAVLDMFSDFVTIGTIADVVSLTGENRTIVKYGIERLLSSQYQGVRALIEQSGMKTVSAENVAFMLAPRINAAGRLGKTEKIVELLCCEDPEDAKALAGEMEELNFQRKQLEKKILEDIQEQIINNPHLLYNRVLLFYGENWHHGIIGIACSKISDHYGKPCILISMEGAEARGSARSIDGFSIYDAIVSASSHLTRFGGHEQAAGFSLPSERVEEFNRDIQRFAAQYYDEMPDKILSIDKIIGVGDISPQNAQALSLLEPFGRDFEQPVFAVTKAVLAGITPLSDDKHLRLKITQNGQGAELMLFHTSLSRFPFSCGDVVDIAFTLHVNEYNGSVRASAFVKDIRLSGFSEAAVFKARQLYEKIRRGEPVPVSAKEKILPARNDVAVVYKYLKEHDGQCADYFALCCRMQKYKINYCKLMLILDLLQEVKLLSVDIEKNRFISGQPREKIDLGPYLAFENVFFTD